MQLQTLLSLLPLVLATATTAQAVHTQLFPTVSPGGRAGTHGVSDGTGVLLFGGLLVGGNPPTFTAETWRFDGVNWSNLTPAVSPPARDWYASAYDTARGRLVLFGGRVVSGATTVDVGDTWEFDGIGWLQLSPANAPSARRWAAMTYEPTASRCLLFGGSTGGSTYLGDTWAWDGTNWTQLAPANSPSPRGRGWLEWDYVRSRALYVGGRNTAALAETWSWDGTDWSQVITTNFPGWNSGPGLFAFGMTYDLLRDRVVVVGGTRTSGVSNQTWEFDGTDWLLHDIGPISGRTVPTVAYVAGQARTILYGGFGSVALSDTWEYQTANFPSLVTFGTGCAGPNGVPTITETHPAWLGETFTADVGNLATGGLAVATVGLSDTAWSGGALPFQLALLYAQTASTCQLLVSPDANVFLPVVGNSATLALALPSDPAFLGQPFFTQALQLDAQSNLSVSAGASLIFGAK